MPRKPLPKGGFTLVEVLIAVAIISIGMLGTMAALAFGMMASRDTAQHSTALNYNRRILEIFYAEPRFFNDLPNNPPASPFDPPESTNWWCLYYNPARPDGQARPGILPDWLELSHWHELDTPACRAFQLEEPKYRVNVARVKDIVEPNPASTDPKSRVFRIIVQTRWREKVGPTSTVNDTGAKWRFVRTEAAYVETEGVVP